MIYFYHIRLGNATLNKMDSQGNDLDKKPKLIGKFKSEEEAKKACLEHFNKSVTLAQRVGREIPTMVFN
jgi:hypothetical protein